MTFRDSTGDYQGAWEYLQKEQPILAARLQVARENRDLRLAEGKWQVKSGLELAKLGSRDEAINHFHQGVQIFEALYADGPDAISSRYLAAALQRFGDAQLIDADAAHALQSYQRERQILEPLLVRDPTNAVVQLDMAAAIARVGNAQAFGGNTILGLAMLNRASTMLRAQIKHDPSYNEPPWFLVSTLMWTGEALDRNGDFEGALKTYREILTIWEQTKHPLAQTILAGAHQKIARVLAKTGKREYSFREAHLALTQAQQLIAAHPYMRDAQYVAANADEELGKLAQDSATAAILPKEKLRYWAEARDVSTSAVSTPGLISQAQLQGHQPDSTAVAPGKLLRNWPIVKRHSGRFADGFLHGRTKHRMTTFELRVGHAAVRVCLKCDHHRPFYSRKSRNRRISG